MAVTRINNNQISDASAGNVYVGINAAVKLQNYSVTGTKLANNLTYGSDLTVTGNLTIQGNTTTIDTTYTTIEDPTILLASNQTGAPAVDIGFVGERGTANNIAWVWKESASEFVAVYTTTGESNTTISIASYADIHSANANIGGNLVVNGNASVVGTVVGNVTLSGNITMGNVLTSGQVSATGTVTGGNLTTAGTANALSFTGTVVSVSGNITSAGNVAGGNLLATTAVSAASHLGTLVSVSGNITGGNLFYGSGNVSGTGNISGGNVLATTTVSAASHIGTLVSVSGAVTGGNINTAGNVSATGNILSGNVIATGNISGSNVIATLYGNVNATTVSASGNITTSANVAAGNMSASGNISASYYFGNGSQLTGVTASTSGFPITAGTSNIAAPVANGNITVTVAGTSAAVFANTGIFTGQLISATGNLTAGNIITSGFVSATGNITGGNVIALTLYGNVNATTVSASGNITGGNVIAPTLYGNVVATTVSASGNVSATGNVLGGNLVAATAVVTPTVIGTTVTISATGGLITLSPSSNVSVSSKNINNLAQPVQDQDAATKLYVDNMVSTQLSYHQAVYAATVANLATTTGGTITYSQPNGAGNGVGALITTTGNFTLIDTANVQTANTRILVKDEGNAVLNGVYYWANAKNIIRTLDADQYGPSSAEQLSINDYFFVSSGNVNAGSAWIVDSPSGTITFGTSNIAFAQFSSSQTYSANTQAGILLTGTVISAKVDNNTTAFDGGGNIIVKASANLTTPNIGNATGSSLSVTGNITGGNVIATTIYGNVNATTVSASGNTTAGNLITAGIANAASFTGTVVSVSGNITSAANIAGGNVLATTIVSGASHLGTLVSVSGNITGGNLFYGAGNVSGTGNVSGGNLLITTTVSAASHIGSMVSVTGNVTAAGLTSSANISATANISASYYFGNGSQLTGISASTSGFPITAGTSNIAAATNGNIGVTVAGTSNVLTIASTGIFVTGVASANGNVTAGNVITAGIVSAAGNIIGGTDLYIGNGAANTTFTNPVAIFKDAGTGYVQVAIVNSTGTASADFTAYSNDGTDAQGWMDMGFTGNTFNDTNYSITLPGDGYLLSQGNAATGGNLVISTGNIGNTRDVVFGFGFLAANEFIRFQRSTNTILPAGNLTANIGNATRYLANIFVGNTVGSTLSMTGNIVGANINTGGTNGLTLNGSNINSNATRITINSANSAIDFAVNGSSAANVFYINGTSKTASFGNATQTTNAIVTFNANTSVVMPVGNTAQRPGTGVTGMMRFNSTLNAVEVYDNSSWAQVGTPSFTVIADEQFTGNGVQTAFTLSSSSYTTNGVIVSINGIVQIPTSAYAVSGATLTFTEAPQTGDLIDVRELVTTTSVTSISNSPGNAIISVSATSNEVSVTGNLLPVSNNVQSLGSPTLRWKDLYVSGNTITMGNVVMKNVAGGNTIGFYGPDGSTPATIAASSVDTTQIASGTSNMAVIATNGNIRANVNGAAILSITSNGIENGQANGVGNIGSLTTYFNTVFAKATSAYYADLAENYVADAEYAPGTVLSFGGEHEVTLSAVRSDQRIAGVVSTNPSYIMNSTQEGEFVATIALTGRVPTFVSGTIAKGDMMVSDGNGRAIACATPVLGTVIGKALENHAGGDGVIEVVVGRL